MVSLALFLADSSARTADLPVALLQALLAGLVLWLVAKHILAPNPISVPLMLLLVTTPDDLVSWIRAGRPDLQTNAAMLAAMVIAAFAWVVSARRADMRPGTPY